MDVHRVVIGVAGAPGGPKYMLRAKIDDKEIMTTEVRTSYVAHGFRSVTITLLAREVIEVPMDDFEAS